MSVFSHSLGLGLKSPTFIYVAFYFFFFFRKLKITTNKNFFVRKYFGIEGGYEQIYFVPSPESELFPT